jgi:hypothetical protein
LILTWIAVIFCYLQSIGQSDSASKFDFIPSLGYTFGAKTYALVPSNKVLIGINGRYNIRRSESYDLGARFGSHFSISKDTTSYYFFQLGLELNRNIILNDKIKAIVGYTGDLLKRNGLSAGIGYVFVSKRNYETEINIRFNSLDFWFVEISFPFSTKFF